MNSKRQQLPPTLPQTTSPRGTFQAAVQSNTSLCREHFLLRIRVTDDFPPTQPGQFIQIGCRAPLSQNHRPHTDDISHDWDCGTYPTITHPTLRNPLALLRRPFSLAGRQDNDHGTQLDIIHRVIGTGTNWMSNLQPDDPIDLIGPLGNWFRLPPPGQLALLVGGGVGLPPMLYLAQALHQHGCNAVAFVGAMTSDLLPITINPALPPDTDGSPNQSVQDFAQHGYDTVVTTDDGSTGLCGRITDGLTAYLSASNHINTSHTIIYTCGPEPMMKTAAQIAAQHHISCQACVEQAMACGMGTCQSCVVKIQDDQHPQDHTTDGRPWRYRLTCTDGPIFDATDVIW